MRENQDPDVKRQERHKTHMETDNDRQAQRERGKYTVRKEETERGLPGGGGGGLGPGTPEVWRRKGEGGDSQVFPPQLSDTRPLTMGVGPDWRRKY